MLKSRLLLIALLSSFSAFGQINTPDTLHSMHNTKYDTEAHQVLLTAKYIGLATTIVGGISLNEKNKNGAGQEELDGSLTAIAIGGIISGLSQLFMDLQVFFLGKATNKHISSKRIKSKETISDETNPKNVRSLESILLGPLDLYIKQELIFIDNKGVEYVAHLLYYNELSGLYKIQYEKNGRQKTKLIDTNRFHQLKQIE